MPELPDVEGHRRVAERHVTGKTVREIHVGDPAVVRDTTPQGPGTGDRRCHAEHPTPHRQVGDAADRCAALRRTLDVGTELGRVPASEGSLTDVRDDDEPRCPRCGATLAWSTVAGRASIWCPDDQVAP